MDIDYPCVVCNRDVGERQEALRCDDCRRWQHRKCNTGISRLFYRKMVRKEVELTDWRCGNCSRLAKTTSRNAAKSLTNTPASKSAHASFHNAVANTPKSESAHASFHNAVANTPTSESTDITFQQGLPNTPTPLAESTRTSFYQGIINDTFVVNVPPPQEQMDIPEHSEQMDIDNQDVNESSFTINQVSFQRPANPIEESLTDQPPPMSIIPEQPVTFRRVEEGSQRGKAKLVDSIGYSYTIKMKTQGATYWTCSVRNRQQKCTASVTEKGDVFRPGRSDHTHPAQPGLYTATVVTTEVKKRAKGNVFQPANLIVERVMSDKVDETRPCPSLSKPINLQRTCNRVRQTMRPADPKDLNFEIDNSFLPEEFLIGDVRVGEKRHLVFATDRQLELLSRAKTWYLDATFKIIKKPFSQLFSVHAFIRSETYLKQVPLAFCFMSGKRKRDYAKVLQCIKDHLPEPIKLECSVTDFEAGIWQGTRLVFPDVQLHGCVFHWTQAVFRKVQNLGMEPAYELGDGMFKYIRKVLALPFLPAEHIEETFVKLRDQATSPELVSLLDYIQETWMENQVWSIENWSVYGLAIRTNNDVEGWHRRLNHRATRPSVQFYLLVPLIHEEASLLPLQIRLVSEGKMKRLQRKKCKILQGKIFKLWDKYDKKEKTASQLLRAISALHGPVRKRSTQ